MCCLSETGIAGGTDWKQSPTRPFRGTTWASGGPSQPIPAEYSTVVGVNDAGDAVGRLGLDSSHQHAFVVRGGKLIDLVPSVVPEGSIASDINNRGVVTGQYGIGPDERAFVYDSLGGGPPTVTDPPPGRSTTGAHAINDAGIVVGRTDGNGFAYSGGVIRDMGPTTHVGDINNLGVIIGTIEIPAKSTQAAICDLNTTTPSVTEIPLPPGNYIGSHGFGINNARDAVGTCWTRETSNTQLQDAYIYSGGVSTNLNTLIPFQSGWHLTSAEDIDDRGQIVGNGTLNGHKRGFLLTPTTALPHVDFSHLVELVGTILGFQPVDGAGLVIVGGVPIPVGPWGPHALGGAEERDVLIGLALAQMAMTIENRGGRLSMRRAALEMTQERITEVLERLRQEG